MNCLFFSQVTFRNIEQAIKSVGMHSEDLLEMIENCPENAETLVARIVHLVRSFLFDQPFIADQ
jgi:hypothetical protein